MLHRPLSYNFKNNVASHRPDRLSRWRRLLMARQAGARAQSRPKPTLEGGQSLFRRAGGVWDARRRHIGGGEKGAEAHSRCCAARSQTVGCTHRLCSFSGSMGRLMPARPAARRWRVCGCAQPDQDEAGDGLRHSHDQRPSVWISDCGCWGIYLQLEYSRKILVNQKLLK